MAIVNLSAYKFVQLSHLETLREMLLQYCAKLDLKGTILLSHEGINLNIAGCAESCQRFIDRLTLEPAFEDLIFKLSYSDDIPFDRVRVMIKAEIIHMGVPNMDPHSTETPYIDPEELKQWLDEDRDFVLLDTRNDYEIEKGTFDKAEHLNLKTFKQFPEACEQAKGEWQGKPVVMFCTGGVRCEKAGAVLQAFGAKEVYQLHGGILNYFNEVGREHYHGECFVFDDREAITDGH